MSLTINLPLDAEQKLLRQAAERGQDVTEYIRGLVEDDARTRNGAQPAAGGDKTFDEVLEPVREGWAESGLPDEEVDRLFEETLKEVRQSRRKGG